MSPELDRLLEALYEKLTCPPEERARRVATFERLLEDALARRPVEFCRQRQSQRRFRQRPEELLPFVTS
jgi:hypothetical protein